jgi:hypothetical protein
MHSGALTGRVIPRIIYSCPIATPTIMIKSDVLKDKEYRFDINHTIGEDTCFWLNLLRNRNVLGIDEDLTIVNVFESSAAYSIEKQILGLKTILTFVLNDNDYKDYNYEIALLCNAYINEVNKISKDRIDMVEILCPNCLKIMNSRSWKLTKPLRVFSKGIKFVKEYGLVMTAKKAITKLLKVVKK